MNRNDQAAVSLNLAKSKLTWHRAQAALSLKDKVRILLELQKQDLPLIAKQRRLRSWERPWPIEP